MALEQEKATFDRLLPTELGVHQGRFAVISGEKLVGVYDTYSDALAAGYEAAGLSAFLVKQIAPFAVVMNFTRDVQACTQPAQ